MNIKKFFDRPDPHQDSADRQNPATAANAAAAAKTAAGKKAKQKKAKPADKMEAPRKIPLDQASSDLTARIKAMQAQHNAFNPLKQKLVNRDPFTHATTEGFPSDILYKLGFADSAQRSEDIIYGLACLGVLGSRNDPRASLEHPQSIVDALVPEKLPRRQALVPKEAAGLVQLLSGIHERHQELGRDITALQVVQRPMFFFYAGLAENPDVSHNLAVQLQTAGILDKNLLPLHGGEKYDELVRNFVERNLQYNNKFPVAEVMETYARIREALFPLPTYGK